jgi:hypothetical protein
MASEPTLHGGGEVVEGEDGPLISISDDALEDSGIEAGEKVLIATHEGGEITLIPWTRAELQGMVEE